MKKVIIIGFGKIGQRYFEILKKYKIKILVLRKTKKKVLHNNNNITKSFDYVKKLNKKTIDCVIIASPPETHWIYLNFFLKKKIDIIIEKPVITKNSEFLKLNKVMKEFNGIFLINHSDLYDSNFLELLKKKFDLGNIKKINFLYGNDDNRYQINNIKSPLLDWLPHILAIIIILLEKIDSYKIIFFKRLIKNDLVFEKVKINFISNNIKSFLVFSNFPSFKSRNILIKFSDGLINYDAYENNNYLIKNKKKIKFSLKRKTSFTNLIKSFFIMKEKNIKHNDYYIFKKYFKFFKKITLQNEKK